MTDGGGSWLGIALPGAAMVLVTAVALARAQNVTSPQPEGVTSRPSPGCTRPHRAIGATTLTMRDGDGVERTYEVHPPHDPSAGPVPLVISFHGAGGHAADAIGYGLEAAPGAQGSAVFVYPEGREVGSYGRGWDDRCQGYDMVFFDGMVSSIEDRYCVDENRVFVAGFSWGCDFAAALACCRGDRIRGIAAAACSDDFEDPADPATYINRACPVTSRAAVRFTHQEIADPAYPAPLFATTSAYFRARDACAVTSPEPASLGCVAYRGCRQGVTECTFRGIGHAVGPGWAAETWTFFSKLR